MTWTIIILWAVSLIITYKLTRYLTAKLCGIIIVQQYANNYDMEVIDDTFDKIISEVTDKGWKGRVYILIGMNEKFREALKEYCDKNQFKLNIKYDVFTEQSIISINK